MFEKGGVRYAPGSMVRKGAFIGPQTVVMNMAFVNIGAHIAGKGCMIDGGARVASCAQIGEMLNSAQVQVSRESSSRQEDCLDRGRSCQDRSDV